MDIWKFYDITHREHVICNPTNEDKLGHLVDLLRLPVDGRVVDIACGKGELLSRLSQAYRVRCLGIDLSPFFVAEARRRLTASAPGDQAVVLHMNGADFEPDEPHSFSAASCLGASWIYSGYAGTLNALASMVVPGGWVIVGEPYWLQEPPEEYLQVLGQGKEVFGTHAGNVEVAEQRGLDLVHTLVSNKDDWDRYEGLQWYAAAEYARWHPDDPDVPELVGRVAREKAAFLRWGRDTLGWAIYVFRHRIPEPMASAV